MDTSGHAISIGRRRRRRHSAAFKAEAIAACRQPGVSIAAVALSRSLNANLLRRWVAEAERTGAMPVEVRSAGERSAAPETSGGFLPLPLPAKSMSESSIRIEVRRGASTVSVRWPVSAAHECALLLRELLR
ncbi:MAG TPA: transposase [Casimicrobiaceae bacterium]|nr:transposase [Casimicrobiaceae bacterium]